MTGTLKAGHGGFSIEIPIKPFELAIYPDGTPELVETALRLDAVSLPTMDLTVLSGRTFAYPVNPDDGYIDGSIYIESAHHPADVSSIRFGAVAEEGLEAELAVNLRFEFEGLGEFADTHWICATHLRSEAHIIRLPRFLRRLRKQ